MRRKFTTLVIMSRHRSRMPSFRQPRCFIMIRREVCQSDAADVSDTSRHAASSHHLNFILSILDLIMRRVPIRVSHVRTCFPSVPLAAQAGR